MLYLHSRRCFYAKLHLLRFHSERIHTKMSNFCQTISSFETDKCDIIIKLIILIKLAIKKSSFFTTTFVKIPKSVEKRSRKSINVRSILKYRLVSLLSDLPPSVSPSFSFCFLSGALFHPRRLRNLFGSLSRSIFGPTRARPSLVPPFGVPFFNPSLLLLLFRALFCSGSFPSALASTSTPTKLSSPKHLLVLVPFPIPLGLFLRSFVTSSCPLRRSLARAHRSIRSYVYNCRSPRRITSGIDVRSGEFYQRTGPVPGGLLLLPRGPLGILLSSSTIFPRVESLGSARGMPRIKPFFGTRDACS